MKGTNKLQLNAATMIEALQEYFTARYKQPLKVTSIRQFNATDGTFEVIVQDSTPTVYGGVTNLTPTSE